MTSTQQQLIQILSHQLFGAAAAISPNTDISSLFVEARQQAVFQLVYSYLENTLAPGAEKDSAEEEFAAALVKNIRNLSYHSKLHTFLTAHNIPYVILKGPAAAMYYPIPTLRTMGDVDFLVSKGQVELVDSLLNNKGFHKIDGAEKHDFHWEYRKDSISLELHWEAPGVPDNTTRGYLENMIQDARTITAATGEFSVPSPFHHGLVLLLHITSHMAGGGIGLRHLCDWLVFENQLSDEAFQATFSKPLQDIGLWRFAQVLTKIGVMYFGCSPREWCAEADSSVCTAFLEDILNGGNFGVKDHTRRSQAKLIQNHTTKRVSSSIWQNAFISIHEKAKRDYPLFRRIPLLLPVGWLIVIVQYLVRIATGRRNNVFEKKIYTDAVNRQALYAALKLFEK